MRVRERSVPAEPLPDSIIYFGAPGAHTAEYPTTKLSKDYEYIADINNKRSRPESPVDHWRCKVQKQEPVTDYSTSSSSSYGLGYSLAYPLIDASRIKEVIPPVDIAGIQIQAEKTVNEKMASIAKQWSLVNNILEIDEIPEVVAKIATARSKWLDWQFGVWPLVQDLRTLYGNLTNFRNQIRLYKEQNGLLRRFSYRLPIKLGQGSDTWPGYWNLGLTNPTFTEVSRCTGRATVSVPGFDELDNNLRVLLDVIGLHLDPEVVYDAIPFSWMLDWIVPIGDYLASFGDRRWVKPTIKFERASWSVHRRGVFDCKIVPGGSYNGWSGSFVGQIVFFHYQRGSFSPPDFFSKLEHLPAPTLPRLTPDRALTLLGLAKVI